MPDELRAALERAIDLNAQAISLVEGQPPSTAHAVLASALRENRAALVNTAADVLGSVWEAAFAAGRAYERSQAPAPAPPPALRLVANG